MRAQNDVLRGPFSRFRLFSRKYENQHLPYVDDIWSPKKYDIFDFPNTPFVVLALPGRILITQKVIDGSQTEKIQVFGLLFNRLNHVYLVV